MTRAQLRRGIPYVAVVALSIGLYALESHESGNQISDVNNRVAKVETPCLKASEEPTRKNKELCQESFEKALATLTHPEACAVERKSGTLRAIRALALAIRELGIDVSFEEPCAGARLAQERQRGSERAAAKRQEVDSGSAPPTPNPSKSPQGLGNHGSPGSPSPHHPVSQPPSGTGNSGSEGGTAGPSQPNAPSVPDQSPAAPETPAASEGSMASSGQGVIPSVVEGAGEAVEHVEAEVLAPTLCTVRSLLKPCP
jgi:hypothetical protein